MQDGRARPRSGDRTPAPASRGCSGRRRGRSGRAHRAACRRAARRAVASRLLLSMRAVTVQLLRYARPAKAARAVVTNDRISAGILAARAFLDAARHVDAERPHLARSPRRRCAGDSPPARISSQRCARSAARASSPPCWPVPLRGPSNSTRGRRQRGCRGAAQHRQRLHARRQRRSPARSAASVCSTSGRNTANTSREQRGVRMLRHRDAQRATARRRSESRGRGRRHPPHRRREHEADRIDAGRERGLDRALVRHAADLSRSRSPRRALRGRPAASSRSSPAGSPARHQRAADQRQLVAAGGKARGVGRRRDAALGDARQRRGQRAAPAARAGRAPPSASRDRGCSRRAAGARPAIRRCSISSRATSISASSKASISTNRPQPLRGVDQRVSSAARRSMRTMTRMPPAPASRASATWYGSTRKSLRIVGTRPRPASAREACSR